MERAIESDGTEVANKSLSNWMAQNELVKLYKSDGSIVLKESLLTLVFLEVRNLCL